MKRLVLLTLGVSIVLLLSSIGSLLAQTRAKPALPHVPVTFPGDTDETIRRRAQWIEGAKKEGTLVWWNTVSPVSLGNTVIAEFNKTYPFIKVEQWLQKGEEVAAMLETGFSSGRITADIALGGEPYNYPRWRKMGMLEKFTDLIPGIIGLDKRMFGMYGDWVQPGGSVITPQYNTNLVSPSEAPKSWDDLLDPKWKGQMALTTDLKVWTVMALAEGGWGVKRTEDYLKNFKQQQPIWAQAHSSGLNLLIAGDFKILAENYLFQVLQSQKKGAKIDWVKVNPVVITGPSFILQKRAPHPNAARLFLEWILSPPGLKKWEEITSYGAPFPGMETRQAKLVENLTLAVRTEEVELKTLELGLTERFGKILGIVQ